MKTNKFVPRDQVRENWSPIVGEVIDGLGEDCRVLWPNGRKYWVRSYFLEKVDR